MSKKSKVLKAFLILAAAIAICMYFSRTIQTITTPKVKLVTADVGRIEQKISVALTPYFPVKTEITLTKAKDYPITVDKVYVKTGLYVEKGDTILTAVINDYDKKEKELTDSYAKKAQELIELDITNRKNSKQSMQNDLYDDMLAKQDALSDAESKARLAAAKEGLELSYDQSTWLAKAQSAKASDEVTALINAAVTAKQNFDQARQDFFDSYENKKIKVADDVFKYIKFAVGIAKGEVPELDIAFERFDIGDIFAVGDIAFCFKQLGNAVQACFAARRHIDQIGNSHNGPNDRGEITYEFDELTCVENSVIHKIAAVAEYNAYDGFDKQRHKNTHQSGEACVINIGVLVFTVQAFESHKLTRFLDERLYYGDARKALLRKIRQR